MFCSPSPSLHRFGRLSLLAVAAALAAPGACRKPDSILLVEVAGLTPLSPMQFGVTVTVGLDSRRLMIPPNPGSVIALPTSFSVEVDPSRVGPVTVSVDALDDSSSIIGCGTTVQQHIQVGGQTVITVFLDSCGAGQGGGGGDDSGTINIGTGSDGGDDAADGGGGPGGAGAAGAGGRAGAGGGTGGAGGSAGGRGGSGGVGGRGGTGGTGGRADGGLDAANG
jgi:hypothetical protein